MLRSLAESLVRPLSVTDCEVQTIASCSQIQHSQTTNDHNNMKLCAILTTFCLAALTPLASARSIGLAISTEHPDSHPANACAASDTLILDEIAAALMSTGETHGRNLYQMSASCRWNCVGFLPGTCWYAFPWCWPFRRSLRGLETPEPHDEPLEQLVEELEVDHSIDCAKAILAAESKMEALAATIGEGECHSALMEKKVYQCFHLNEELM